MLVVLVDFDIKAGFEDEFIQAVNEQAATSLSKEPDCHYFDVCRAPEVPSNFFLYELYSSMAAFELHLVSDHFISFNNLTSDWVKSKSVRLLHRVDPDEQ